MEKSSSPHKRGIGVTPIKNTPARNTISEDEESQTKPLISITRAASDNHERHVATTIASPLAWYAHKLETHPLRTKCVTSALIAGSGDLVCQYVIHHQKKLNETGSGVAVNDSFNSDMKRTFRFAFMGLMFVGPMYHIWLDFLGKHYGGSSATAAFKRVMLDQLVFTPFMIPGFMISILLLEGRHVNDIIIALYRDVIDAYITNIFIWVPALLINFKYIPGKWRVLFSNCVSFGWNSYLSWKTQEN